MNEIYPFVTIHKSLNFECKMADVSVFVQSNIGQYHLEKLMIFLLGLKVKLGLKVNKIQNKR